MIDGYETLWSEPWTDKTAEEYGLYQAPNSEDAQQYRPTKIEYLIPEGTRCAFFDTDKPDIIRATDARGVLYCQIEIGDTP